MCHNAQWLSALDKQIRLQFAHKYPLQREPSPKNLWQTLIVEGHFHTLTRFICVNKYIHCVSKKTRRPIVTIISSNLIRFQNSFTARKSVTFATQQYVTLPTKPKIRCRTTLRNCGICGIRITSLQTSPQCLETCFLVTKIRFSIS